MKFEVFFDEAAEDDLDAIYRMIAASAGERTAGRFIGRLRGLCLSLADFPRRGRQRDDLGTGIRTLVFAGRVLVGYEIEGEAVYVVHFIYAGRDYGPEDFQRQ